MSRFVCYLYLVLVVDILVPVCKKYVSRSYKYKSTDVELLHTHQVGRLGRMVNPCVLVAVIWSIHFALLFWPPLTESNTCTSRY
jgi:hypothetical protein